MSTQPRESFAHYEIRSKIGSGGMGEVYLAEDTKLDRQVALKVLLDEVAGDSERVRRFVQEAKAASALNHPNILTVYEIGEFENSRYIATELIKGETLRKRINGEPLTLGRTLDIAMQVAAALNAAHGAGIVHRDIKPENIMLRDDGFVKVLDFGLAKLSEQRPESAGSEDATKAQVNTAPGMVMGTVQYMSPEQARGKPTDPRSDIWSLGIVLYEMLSKQTPFAGETTTDTLAAIVMKEPPPLGEDFPSELLRIVQKTLQKKADERYQTVKDLLLDLKNLKRELEFSVELERSHIPNFAKSANVAAGQTESLRVPPSGGIAADTEEEPPKGGTQNLSSAEYIVNTVKSHKLKITAALALVVIVAFGASTYMLYARKPILTDKDTILLTEFENKTGEEVFDSTLKQGLAVQLQQSPFLDIFPDTRARSTLRLMSKSPDDKVTRDIGREICQRTGLKAYIVGSIAKFDRNYSITLEALNGQTGEPLALTLVQAEGKDQVLNALSRAAIELREKLGESLSSIQKFDAPLELTSSSLEALKAFSLGYDQSQRGKYLEAIAFYKRAAELDPNFAYVYSGLAVQYSNNGQPKLAAENAEKAFALRERVSELEKLRILNFYYTFVTGEIEKSIEALELNARTYPRDGRAYNNLSDRYGRIGQFEKAVETAREGIRLNPNSYVGYANLADALIHLNRLSEANSVIEQAQEQKLDSTLFRTSLYRIAFVNGDQDGMRQQLTWLGGKPDEYVAIDWQTQTASFAGEWHKSQDFSRRSAEMATGKDAKETAAVFTAEQAVRAAWLGEFAQAVTLAESAIKIERSRDVLVRAAFAFALAGDAAKVQPLIAELEKDNPKNTLVNGLSLPEVKAALALNKGQHQAALDLLEPTRRFEPADEFRSQTLRAMAYLKLGKAAEAAAEYRKIIDHRGEGPLSLIRPLAHLGLARALAMQDDTAQAKQMYDEFFRLWANADADLPVLIDAKKEYAKL